jgi:energy-coupling factor transporter transmembrane protein EcfT
MRSEKLSKPIKLLLIYLIEEVPLLHYGFFFISGVLVFSFAYFILTPRSHGLGSNGLPIVGLTFWNALYFSIVTVSSLGYGDMYPMGFSKILACLEVLSGLILMGIMLAKMTSARLSYHVARLFSSEIQKRMENFAEEFKVLHGRFKTIMQSLQETPGNLPASDQSKVFEECTQTISTFHSRSSSLAGYITYEVEHCDFFSIAPTDSMNHMAEAIYQAISLSGQMVLSMTAKARSALLTPVNSKGLLYALDEHKQICCMVREHCMDNSLKREFSGILEICESFPENFFAVPILVGEGAQPDQKLEKSNEPQP